MLLKRDSPNLDILRSFAVAAVLLHHLAQRTPRGQQDGFYALHFIGRAGVLIFFVHTSLVLMGSLQRLESKGAGSHLLRAFYLQRFFRLYPLSVSCVTAVVLVHAAIPSLHLPWLTLKPLLANLALVQNLTWDPSIIGPLWSLPYEMQMYLVLPFIYLLTKRPHPMLFLAILWVAAAAIGSFLFFSDPRYLTVSYQYPFTWFVPTFLGGVAAFVMMRRRHLRLPSILWPVLILSIFVLVQSMQLQRSELWMTLLGFAIPHFAEMENQAVRITAHTIAKYSYGIYLIHEPLLDLCVKHLPSLGLLPRYLLFFLLLALLAVAAYHLIEKPMIDLGHRLSNRIARKQKAEDALTGQVISERI